MVHCIAKVGERRRCGRGRRLRTERVVGGIWHRRGAGVSQASADAAQRRPSRVFAIFASLVRSLRSMHALLSRIVGREKCIRVRIRCGQRDCQARVGVFLELAWAACRASTGKRGCQHDDCDRNDPAPVLAHCHYDAPDLGVLTPRNETRCARSAGNYRTTLRGRRAAVSGVYRHACACAGRACCRLQRYARRASNAQRKLRVAAASHSWMTVKGIVAARPSSDILPWTTNGWPFPVVSLVG
jgi:hypothetical protein